MVDHAEGQHPGLGGLQSPPDERDFPISELLSAAVDLTTWIPPASYFVPGMPSLPVLNQGTTPQCVAYSSSASKAFQDTKDQGRFYNFDEALFFRLIGGTSNGAILRNALDRMLKVGYPVYQSGDATHHRIKAYYAVTKAQTVIQAAIHSFGPLLLATPWYHSWFHPVNGVLPRADYQAGGHAIVAYGWNGNGLRLRNSWGSTWGYKGDCFMPWSYALGAVWEYWKTVDVID